MQRLSLFQRGSGHRLDQAQEALTEEDRSVNVTSSPSSAEPVIQKPAFPNSHSMPNFADGAAPVANAQPVPGAPQPTPATPATAVEKEMNNTVVTVKQEQKQAPDGTVQQKTTVQAKVSLGMLLLGEGGGGGPGSWKKGDT